MKLEQAKEILTAQERVKKLREEATKVVAKTEGQGTKKTTIKEPVE